MGLHQRPAGRQRSGPPPDVGKGVAGVLVAGLEPLAQPGHALLAAAVCFKGRGFVPIDPKKPKIGLVCTLSDYAIKIYDTLSWNNVIKKYCYVYNKYLSPDE